MIPQKVLEVHYEELERIIFDLALYTADKEEVTIIFPVGDIKILVNGRYEDNNKHKCSKET